jgi:hypothetical protein
MQEKAKWEVKQEEECMLERVEHKEESIHEREEREEEHCHEMGEIERKYSASGKILSMKTHLQEQTRNMNTWSDI